MKCPYCYSDFKKGTATLTFQMAVDRIVVVRDVPAWICEQCGEESVDMSISRKVEKQVEQAISGGIHMGFIDFNHSA